MEITKGSKLTVKGGLIIFGIAVLGTVIANTVAANNETAAKLINGKKF